MSPIIPIKLFPLAAKSVNSGGLVVAILIGLALHAATKQNKQKANTNG